MNKFITLHSGINNSKFYLNVSHIVSFERSYDNKETIIHISIQEDAPYYRCKETPYQMLKLIKSL